MRVIFPRDIARIIRLMAGVLNSLLQRCGLRTRGGCDLFELQGRGLCLTIAGRAQLSVIRAMRGIARIRLPLFIGTDAFANKAFLSTIALIRYWSGAPRGEIKFSDIAEEDLFCVLPAICHFMSVLKADLPDTRIIFIANCDIDGCVVDCIKTAGAHFGVEVVELEHIDKQSGHPTSLGMEQICSQVLSRF